jgi:ABC-type hemin transport system substrate-binding protein
MDDGQILGFGPVTPEVLNALAVGMYAPEDDRPSAGGGS